MDCRYNVLQVQNLSVTILHKLSSNLLNRIRRKRGYETVFRIRLRFQADPDPDPGSKNVHMDLDPDPAADPDPSR